MQLSYSASDKYLMSPRYYYYHYLLRIRPEKVGSALLFGSAMDVAFNSLLLKDGSAHDNFDVAWCKQEINGESVDLWDTDKVIYSKADYDESILTDEDNKLIAQGMIKEWVSLKRKAHIIIEEYEKQIIPKIKKVHQVQYPFKIKNNDGDIIIGFIDLIATMDDGLTYIIDNKTSGSSYKSDSASLSRQLATYNEAINQELKDLKIDGVAYIVIPKNFRKKKLPIIEIKFIPGQISEEVFIEAFDGYEKTLNGIKNAEFPCGYPNCNIFGGCCYEKLCQTGSTEGLVKLAQREYKK